MLRQAEIGFELKILVYVLAKEVLTTNQPSLFHITVGQCNYFTISLSKLVFIQKQINWQLPQGSSLPVKFKTER